MLKKVVSMPSQADDSFLHHVSSRWSSAQLVSMPSQADDSFLQQVGRGTGRGS